MGIIDVEHLFAELLEENVRSVGAVHHMHVDLPHPSAGIDHLLEVLQQLDIRGCVKIQGFYLVISFQHLLDVSTPEPIIVIDEGPDGFPELLLPFLFLLVRIDEEKA